MTGFGLVRFDLNAVSLGILLLASGIGLVGLILILTRLVPRLQPHVSNPFRVSDSRQLKPHGEAVLLVQTGGRVVYLNEEARLWFKLAEDEPNLERMARQVRPSEALMSLCAGQGQVRLSLGGRYLEGSSYFAAYDGEPGILVALRRSQLAEGSLDSMVLSSGDSPGQTLGILNQINRTLTASLEITATIRAIFDGVERLLPADYLELAIWRAEERNLEPYIRVGMAGEDRPLEKLDPVDHPGGYRGVLLSSREPLLVPDVALFTEVSPDISQRAYRFRSYLGLPLLVAGELIGVLEVSSIDTQAFGQSELEILKLLSYQAAVALQHAVQYDTEQNRVQELEGLAKLSISVSAIDDPRELFNRLVETISQLFEVEVLGFLLYDENRRVLEGQIPFKGIQSNVVEWYRTTIQPGSEAEKILFSMRTILANNAPQDPVLESLELHYVALAGGIQSTVLVPLNSGGRMIGYLQAGDKLDGSPFDQSDARLLTIIAGQTAPMIENVTLLHQSRRRAQRSETLRRIASLTGSTATLDEILKYSLLDLARLLQADIVGLYLLDEDRGELRLQKDSVYGVDPQLANRLSRISINDPQFPKTVTGSRQQYVTANIKEEKILPVYQDLVDHLEIHSAINVPLIVRERGIGELMIGSIHGNYFNRGDVLSAATAAGLLASAIEQAALYTQTDESLRQRVEQLTALSQISRELSASLDRDYLLKRVYNAVLRTTRADCGTILLFDTSTPNENTSEPVIALQFGDPVNPPLSQPMKQVIEIGESIIIDQFDEDLEQQQLGFHNANNESTPPHSGIRSALLVPIEIQDQVVGLIDLHAHNPHAFDETSRQIGETLAVQAAIAIGNAHRYREQVLRSEQLNRRLDTLSRLYETSQTLRSEITLEEALDSIALAIQSVTPFEVVLISVFDSEKNALHRVSGAGLTVDTLKELQAHQQPWQAVLGLLREEFCLGQAYFIPYEQMPILPDEIHSITLLEDDQSQSESSRWHPEDVLLIPLLREDGSPLGLVSVDAPRNNLRPDRPSIEALEIFASQAALAIEVQQRIQLLRIRMEHAEESMNQAVIDADAARENLPVLLHKDLEQTLAIRELSERAQRIQAGLEIAENVNRRGSRAEVLAALGEEILGRMAMDLALVAEMSIDGPRLLYTLGTIPAGLKPDALFGQRNPLRQSLQQEQIVLVSNLDETPEWQNAPLLYALDCKGFLCLPIIAQNQPVAAVLAISRSPLAAFNDDDKKLYHLLARQVAMTLQNLNLLEIARRRLRESNMLMDFSRQLGGLDPVGILPALAANSLQVVPSARAALVAMWNPRTGLLQPEAAVGYANMESLVQVTYHIGEGLPGRVFAEAKPVRIAEIDFARDYNLSSEMLLHYRDATAGAPPVSSMLVPITTGPQAEPLGILVLDNFTTPQAFTLEDETLITTLTHQTALTLENAKLYQAAEKRARELQALTNVAATITGSLEPVELVTSLLDQLQEILAYDTGTLWLRQANELLVQADRGFLDNESRVGLSVAIEDSLLLKEMIETGQPISVPNVREDERFPSLIPYTRLSWLGLPLIASGEVIGVIALEKKELNYYSHEQIQIAKTFSSQAAVGLANARMYQESVQRAVELDERSQRLAALNRLSGELSSSLDPVQILHFAVQELYKTITCSAVSGLLFENDGLISLRAEYPLTGLELPFEVPASPLFERLRESLGVYASEDVHQEPELEQLAMLFERFQTRGLLILPITTGGELHGLMLAHEAGPHRFEADEVELALTVSNQVAITVQNARLFAQTRSLTEDLEERVNQRTSELEREHQRIAILLRIITELSASLDLGQVLSRTLGVLNEILDAEQITVLITRDSGRTLHRIASVGYTSPTPEEGAATPFNTGEGLAGWVITNRKAALIDDVLEDDRWVRLPGTPNEHRSALAVPLMIGAEALGTMLLFHHQAAHFSPEHLDLVQAAGNQVAVAVNNAELYRLIRDQAEDLGVMLRNQQVETSRSKAILEAVADGVLVTDSDKRVTLFNPSAEEILGLDRIQVQGKSLENFIGLFGRAARSWMQTIDAWSQDPETAQNSETYAEQITLENGRVVAVRLSPVSMRNDFLGTVSIFQDITHQVEVDRLKSEFVATVSHELRTPMTSIKGYVEVLLMGAAGDLNEQQTRFLEVVKENTDRLTVLVNDLLDISRIESGRIVLSRQALDIQEIIDQAMMDLSLRSREDEKPVIVIKEIDPGLPRVYGDLERVLQILANLLDNAYHYNTAEGQIIIRASSLGRQVQIDVIDTGVGIPPDEQSRVFERFYRGESPLILGVSGTGLGLSIVQSLVAMHGGEIWLESSGVLGEGSKFSFTLPAYTPLEEMKVQEYGKDFNR